MIAEKFEVRLLVDNVPLDEKMTGSDTYVLTPFNADSTFLVKEQLKEPDGTPYYEEWRFTPFTVLTRDTSAVQHDYWVKVYIDGDFAACGHMKGQRTILGFSEENDSTATKQFCFTPPRRVGGAELGRGSTLSAERLKQLATVSVDFHSTYMIREDYVDDRNYNSSFHGVNKEDVKKASKAAAVAMGQDIQRTYGPKKMTFWQPASPENFITSCTINYTTVEGFAALGANDDAEDEALRNRMNKPRVDGVLANDLASTFDIPGGAISAGIAHVRESELLLVPKCRKPTRVMVTPEHTSMSEGRDIILGLTAEDSPAAWTSVGKAAVSQMQSYEGSSDSLFRALAHQITWSDALAPVIRSVVAGSLPIGSTLEGMNDFDVLKHFTIAFKCYVAAWPLGHSQPILFKSPESRFATACYMLAVNPSARGAGKGQWASLISSGQEKDERMAKRRAKRAREEDQGAAGGAGA